jgi:hypothetical protein
MTTDSNILARGWQTGPYLERPFSTKYTLTTFFNIGRSKDGSFQDCSFAGGIPCFGEGIPFLWEKKTAYKPQLFKMFLEGSLT